MKKIIALGTILIAALLLGACALQSAMAPAEPSIAYDLAAGPEAASPRAAAGLPAAVPPPA